MSTQVPQAMPGVVLQDEIAAVIVVFERAPAAMQAHLATLIINASTPTGSTKCNIDETLTGEARRKAIENAAKKAKKEAGYKEKHDNSGGSGGAGGASGAGGAIAAN